MVGLRWGYKREGKEIRVRRKRRIGKMSEISEMNSSMADGELGYKYPELSRVMIGGRYQATAESLCISRSGSGSRSSTTQCMVCV